MTEENPFGFTGEQVREMIENDEGLQKLFAEVEKSELEKKNKEDYLNRYVEFLDKNRTVREVNRATAEIAKSNGFVDYDDLVSGKAKGKKIIFHSEDWQNVALVVLGEEDITESGIRIMAAHADAPRFDLKPKPIIVAKTNPRGDKGLVKLDTHYYGGTIKAEQFGSYQLRGEIVEGKDGKFTTRKLNTIDCVLPPLLPHLNRQNADEKPGKDAYPSDKMDMITGFSTEQELLKAIGLESQEDFARASIEIVPAEPVKMIGELVVGYGQDDRSSVFAAADAICNSQDTKTTKIVMNLDKEEVGSEGRSGSKSNWKDTVIARTVRLKRRNMYESQKYEGLDEPTFIRERVLPKSICISADVTAALDPTYLEKFDSQNAAHFGNGVAIERYTGHHGKYEASEASAETMFMLTRLLKKAGVPHQVRAGLSSKLDIGGGGTVAKYWAEELEVVDVGVPLLGMHHRVETAHKDDLYAQYQMSKAFLES